MTPCTGLSFGSWLKRLRQTTVWRRPAVLPAVSLVLATAAAAQEAAPPIQDVLNKRCVVCHGCYDAPCQLKLSSPDGWARGASKQKVYDSSRLEDAPMTRLGIDARSVPAWRQKDFFSVTDNAGGQSVLEKLLRAGRDTPFKLGAPLPDSIDISTLRKNVCPAHDGVKEYLGDHAQGGMPFAMAPLPDVDFQNLITWAAAGAPEPPAPPELPEDVTRQVDTFEAFLNDDALRARLVARYLYEHLFLAHLHLEKDDPRRFFRLIRSRTPSGEPPEQIATRRPFDAPGGPFFYRLVPLTGTILHKEHMIYEIGPRRLDRYRQLFLDDTWTLDALPAYSTAAGGNPLSTFRAIPARSRYGFLLDDALYFVRSFIRGPVCYGQVAVNVIEDRFWVSFLDPDADLSVTDPAYLERAIPILELPVAISESKVSDRLKSFLQLGPVKYQAFRQSRYARKYAAEGGPDYSDIWNGEGHNSDARLTIYRNFSSASVTTGFTGSVPETAWVIDFPLFERIYYNLVAGFDVFGNVEHQLTTRIYMDSLRREGERIFLSFLPPDQREQLHESWYQGPLVSLVDLWKESALDQTSPSGIAFQSSDPKAEFLTHLLAIDPELWPGTDPINRCRGDACAPADTIAGRLRPLTVTPAPFAKFLPDIALLLVETTDGDEIFSLVHDQAHSNVAFIFNEDLRRQPEEDRLTIVPGQFSSYPNFVFRVPEDRVDAFVAAVRQIRTQDDYLAVIKVFGIRRTDEDFWSIYDRIQAGLNAQDAVEAGLLDLNRYRDPKALDPIERLFEFTFKVE
ncbi:fatty acid cis/trans isomerase [Roseibium sp. Sym1]|uniref:fatty acid cis/trans isomerase n=1 Tax=Roseibium sp. Sym1 TaxID=3016006 RepID=UPI0022B4BCC7|nr:fatty acid cis/trans isomerase [Roseibium sp. Sym1]